MKVGNILIVHGLSLPHLIKKKKKGIANYLWMKHFQYRLQLTQKSTPNLISVINPSWIFFCYSMQLAND